MYGYEHEYIQLTCDDCKIKVKIQSNIQRVFSDHKKFIVINIINPWVKLEQI